MGLSSSLVVGAGSEIFTFVTPFGTFAYQRLVMGYVNATAEFQRHMSNTIGPLLWDTCLSMVDDLCIASETREEHRVHHVTSVLTSLAQRQHSIKPSKMHILRLIILEKWCIFGFCGVQEKPPGVMWRHSDATLCRLRPTHWLGPCGPWRIYGPPVSSHTYRNNP